MAITANTPLADIPTPDDVAPLFEPFQLGPFQLKTRVVYAPLTRCRAIGTVPVKEAARYYSERAQEGQLMLTEATVVTPKGHGYPNTPGIYTQEQMDAWRPVVEAVHGKKAFFFCQLWNCGRASHSTYHDGELPDAPSPIAISDRFTVYNPKTFEELPFEVPQELALEKIPDYVGHYRTAARNAADVGFDGVEIHAANGYLIDQFLKDATNKRTDAYGGSIENRARFCLEIVDAVIAEIGAERTGIRLSPFGSFLDATSSDTVELFKYVVAECSKRGLAYVHLVSPRVNGNADVEPGDRETLEPFRALASVPFIAAGGFARESGADQIRTNAADLVCIGRWALANPDLLKRWKLKAPLNAYNRDTFYTPGMDGYIDYPFLQDTEHGAKFFEAGEAAPAL